MSENGDGILLIPEGEAGVCVRWCHRRRVVVARGSECWDALDEALSDGEWELPSMSLLFGVEALRVSSLLLRVSRRRVDVPIWNHHGTADRKTSTPTRSLR